MAPCSACFFGFVTCVRRMVLHNALLLWMLSPTMVLVFLTALWISLFVFLDAQQALILVLDHG